MNLPLRLWVVGFMMLVGCCAGATRDKQWQEVQSAVQRRLPKTAITALEPILRDALAEHAYAEATRALAQKIALEAEVAGDKPQAKIARLQPEIEKLPGEMRPLLEAILGHWYWEFFQRNRWQFLRRTETDATNGSDPETWALGRILAEIDRHFTAALADTTTLQHTPIARFDAVLERGSAPDFYRPTLFDFLAYDALSFYQAGEHAVAQAEEEFEIDATGPIFAPVEKFRTWQPTTGDTASPKLKALHLFQALLAFHEGDEDRSAYFDADLARLEYGRNVATGDDKAARYEQAMERFINETEDHPVSARALAALGAQLVATDPARAHALARRGQSRFRDSHGADLCFNLQQRIERKASHVLTERVWTAPWPTLNVTYRNLTKIYFRAVALDYREELRRSANRYLGTQRLAELVAQKPDLAWSADLPPTPDFKERTESLPVPTTLKPGFYAILASGDATFQTADNQLSAAEVWVTDLALILRQPAGSHRSNEGLVLNARTGEPIADAAVSFWEVNNRDESTQGAGQRTDANGRFAFSVPRNGRTIVVAESAGHAIASADPVWSFGRDRESSAETRTVFFTDRELYRPGQSIQFKGIAIVFDQDRGTYGVRTDESVVVTFRDANNQEIARTTVRTNGYGSFSGTFTAPRDRLAGAMQIVTDDGQTVIRVEEYKRPKFLVAVEPPHEAPKLGEKTGVTVKATAYTGAPVGSAKVKWRVERSARLPLWCWWWQPPATKAIAHGTAVTAADGTILIEFPLEPDRSVPAKNEPVFTYAIHADVTDSTGETRSNDGKITAGYTALQASVTADEWQTPEHPVVFSLETRSLDHVPEPAKGSLVVYALRQPAEVQRKPVEEQRYWWNFAGDPKPDPTKPESWELGAKVAAQSFATDATGKQTLSLPLPAGIYHVVVETKDRFGKAVTARATVQVQNPAAVNYGIKVPNALVVAKGSVEPGETFRMLWGTGYPSGRALVEIERGGRPLRSFWTTAGRTQELITEKVTEAMRGGFTVRVTYVRENRPYITQHVVDVPWTNKELHVKWETFRSKLQPGQKETWAAVIEVPPGTEGAAEMVATLYDASLDQFYPNEWPTGFNVLRRERSALASTFQNRALSLHTLHDWPNPSERVVQWFYRAYVPGLVDLPLRHEFYSDVADLAGGETVTLSAFSVSAADVGYRAASTLTGSRGVAQALAPGAPTPEAIDETPSGSEAVKPDLNAIHARRNLNETAFFFPHLLSDAKGVVKLVFTMPEALTEWRFVGFAHDEELRSGVLTGKTVTAKDLMVEPNPPRFVREGDVVEFTVKVTNQTDAPLRGPVRLTFADAESEKSVDAALHNTTPEQTFQVPPHEARSYSWRLTVPDGLGFLTYKAVAATNQVSDGEEGPLPVLSRRMLVRESLPLPIRGKGTRQFEFDKLLASGGSTTLQNQSLTVQMVSQPAWYAVMALPYLIEYPYECSEQVFNRYYANALARSIANSDPKIRRIFEQWKASPGALPSPLEKNQDLKSVLLEETPWVRQAQSETEARHHVGALFDASQVDEQCARALRTLAERQEGSGLWAWFPGGRPSEYISLYIMTGFGRLRHLGVEVDAPAALKSIDALDAWMDERYREILRDQKSDEYLPTSLDVLYLYGRSFFLTDKPVAKTHEAAVAFYRAQAQRFWTKLGCRQSEAHAAIALHRFGDTAAAEAIVRSLKERSTSNDELGMFWAESEESWWWYRAPIETQAMMIEVFDEVAHDARAVEDCKVWLLKQKQTQDWRTTKATADAVYALLLRGSKLLASDARVEVSLGGQPVRPEKVEAGTGFYEQTYVRQEIRPAMGHIAVTKTDDGVSWGSVHWQYLEDVAKITPHTGTPLQLKKSLWIKETTARGVRLKPVHGTVAVGDELVVRLELRTDRDMEFVHLKDQRASGAEPVNVLSRYKYQDGLGYYETTRDTATHFFIDNLRKGTYVFEYSVRVQLKGRYQSGMAEIQSMYAPEFSSHSESLPLVVE